MANSVPISVLGNVARYPQITFMNPHIRNHGHEPEKKASDEIKDQDLKVVTATCKADPAVYAAAMAIALGFEEVVNQRGGKLNVISVAAKISRVIETKCNVSRWKKAALDMEPFAERYAFENPCYVSNTHGPQDPLGVHQTLKDLKNLKEGK